MSFYTPKPAFPAAATASRPVNSKGLSIATIIFTAMAVVGLTATMILLIAAAVNSTNEELGWYFGFSVTASVANVIPALGALILGIVGHRAAGPLSLIATMVGAVVLVVLVGQIVFLLTV